MGAWGSGSFENDDAGDWLVELEEEGIRAVISALSAVADAEADEYIEAPECSMAVAAAEIVAAGRDGVTTGLPDEAQEWLDENPGAFGSTEIGLAAAAVERVLASSELQELWDEDGADNPWRPAIRELLSRLR